MSKKTIEVPWLIGDDCWVLVPIPTWSKPIKCPECNGKGEFGPSKAGNIQQCPDCLGHKTISTCTTTYYTRWSRVSHVLVEMFWHGAANWRVGTLPLFQHDGGKPYMGNADATSLPPEQVFATEAEAIAYAESKGWNWHPAIQGKRPATGDHK